MKIEKVNDNQIRCTLTKEDLDDRHLKISEIAYGSDKAKLLFRDMMQQANYEYGFEAENVPLMIEAIPMSSGCVVFIITKVEDPEELDTRFSKFAPSVHEEEDDYDYEDSADSNLLPPSFDSKTITEALNQLNERLDDPAVFDLFRKMAKNKQAGNAEATNPDAPSKNPVDSSAAAKEAANGTAEPPKPIYRLYSFDSLDILTDACGLLDKIYEDNSILYKNPKNHRYYLLLFQTTTFGTERTTFYQANHLLLEQGRLEPFSNPQLAYMNEHYSILLADQAIHALAQIS